MGLKFLHVGNIAQNGYVNATILRAHGHECDLIAPDLYQTWSSPEWREIASTDIDMSRLGDDAAYPEFYALGREMPRVGDWVAHGPLLIAIQYLALKCQQDPLAHTALSTLAYLRFKATIQRTTEPFAVAMTEDEFEGHLARFDLRPYLRRRIANGRLADRYFDWIRDRALLQGPRDYVNSWNPPLAPDTLNPFMDHDNSLASVVRGLRKRGLMRALGLEFAGPLTDYRRLEALGFDASEVSRYGWAAPALLELASHYDVCIFYGDTPRSAFVAGIDRYWALEHGTIRTVPFEPTIDGRLLASAYLGAERVFLTNTDYASAEPRLEFAPEQRIYSPHPFDEGPAIAFRKTHRRQRDPRRTVFFCAARQDWRSGDPTLAKGNHLYFEAGRLLLDRGLTNFTLRCIDWGIDCDASRALVAKLGLKWNVNWSPMLPKKGLWAAMLDAHAVIDQFVVSALGGIGFEALALGCRLITRDDGINNAVFFEEAPPILGAATAVEIAARMEAVMADRDDLADLGSPGSAWVMRFHSADRIHDLQMAALASLGRGSWPDRDLST